MKNEVISSIIEQLQNTEVLYGKYGNGNPCPYQRTIIDGIEYTLVDSKFLYEAIPYYDGNCDTFSTITRLKEGRREDRLSINGISAKFASLIANNIVSTTEFFNCTGEK